MSRIRDCVALLLVCSSAALGQTAAPNYHVARKISIGGEGGFDYITADPASQRVFLTHSTVVVVYDLAKDTVAGIIPNTLGVHGVALAPDINRGITSNGRDSSVTIFDYKTLAVLKKLHIPGVNPDPITYDSLTKRVFTWNHGTHDATVIDAVEGTVLGTIPGMGTPETAVTDGQGTIWVNLEDSHQIVKVDTRAMKEIGRFSISPCEVPTGMAMDRANRILFSACRSKHLGVIDADKGTLITTALDPLTHKVYQAAVEYGLPPAPATPGAAPGRPPIIPGSFALLIVER